MTIYKCDRCGKLINPKKDMTYYYVQYGVGSAAVHNNNGNANDLCHNCYMEFLKWYKNCDVVWASEEQLKGKVGKDGIYFTDPSHCR